MIRPGVLALGVLVLSAGATPGAGQLPPRGLGAGDEVRSFSLFGGLGDPLDHGFTVGVGPLYFHDWQSSLAATSVESVVTVRDLVHGTSSTTRIPGDPALNNRKFDYDFEIHGPGVRVPVGLPGVGHGGRFGLASQLAFEVTDADVAFTFHDRTQPELSTSLHGSGLQLGAGVELESRFCAACPWSTSWSYWYRTLSGLKVGRGEPIAAPGQVVTRDRVTFDRDTHEVAVRTAYGTSIGKRRIYPYSGVLYQRTDVEIDDELALSSPDLGLETGIRSRSHFASDVTRALAGVEVQLGDSLSGQLEGSTGGGDHGVRLLLLWSPWTRSREPKPPVHAGPPEQPSAGHPLQTLAAFAATGPLVVSYTSRSFEVEAPTRSGWPVVVDFELEEDGLLELTVSAIGIKEPFELPGKAATRTVLDLTLPESLGAGIRMASYRLRALSRSSKLPINFRFYGIGAGQEALAQPETPRHSLSSAPRYVYTVSTAPFGHFQPTTETRTSEPRLSLTVTDFSPHKITPPGPARWEFSYKGRFTAAKVQYHLKTDTEEIDGRTRYDWVPVRCEVLANQPIDRNAIEPCLICQSPRCEMKGDRTFEGTWEGYNSAGVPSHGLHRALFFIWNDDTKDHGDTEGRGSWNWVGSSANREVAVE